MLVFFLASPQETNSVSEQSEWGVEVQAHQLQLNSRTEQDLPFSGEQFFVLSL
jgi:hypothetical protein